MKRYSMPIVFYARLEIRTFDREDAEFILPNLVDLYFHGNQAGKTKKAKAPDMNQFDFEHYELKEVEEL